MNHNSCLKYKYKNGKPTQKLTQTIQSNKSFRVCLYNFLRKFTTGCNGFAYSNFGIKNDKYELEWAADDDRFFNVIQMINSGYQVVERVVSR